MVVNWRQLRVVDIRLSDARCLELLGWLVVLKGGDTTLRSDGGSKSSQLCRQIPGAKGPNPWERSYQVQTHGSHPISRVLVFRFPAEIRAWLIQGRC